MSLKARIASVFSSVAFGSTTAPLHRVLSTSSTPSGRRRGSELLEVRRVARLVGVDEREVDGRLGRQCTERLDRGRDGELDAVVDVGALPRVPTDRRPLLAHVAAQQRAAVGEPTRDAQRRVPGERADLHHAADPQQPREEGHEGALLGRDLHDRQVGHLRPRLVDEPLLHVVGTACSGRGGSPAARRRGRRTSDRQARGQRTRHPRPGSRPGNR